jgi:signal transduction histidine kinase
VKRSDLETETEEFLEEKNVNDPWKIAPSLVNIEINIKELEKISSQFGEEKLEPVLKWFTSVFQVFSLVHEIKEGSGRISEIVSALKNYSFLGQAPVQSLDIHEGLDNTLVILRNKMKKGITVQREYSENLPRVFGYGSELNQVWTNLLDNATDAMKGEGKIIIRTRKENTCVVVEITDDGPGIPASIVDRIFDPFFTTKEPGKGTGLGLATTYGIVTEKHKGTIQVESRPGMTRFTVKIPVDPSSDSQSPALKNI